MNPSSVLINTMKRNIGDNVKSMSLNILILAAIIFYLINMVSPVMGLEIASYSSIIFYCVLKILMNGKNSTREEIVFSLVLCLESILFIVFVKNNQVWNEETGRDKPSKYTNLMEFLRLIFLTQMLLLQIKNDEYPLMAINILLFVFWITAYTMLQHMVSNQTIF